MENIVQDTLVGYYLSKQIVKRAAIVAIIIGVVLTLINQPDALLGNAEIQTLPMILVFLTPFLVVSISQIFGIREAHKAARRNIAIDRGFVRTLFSKGIVVRAVALGLVAGGTNTVIVAMATMAAGQSLDQLPVSLILQALTLPIIFGALSQALSFRRTIGQLVRLR